LPELTTIAIVEREQKL